MTNNLWEKTAATIVAAGQVPIPITETVIKLLQLIMTEEQAEFIWIFHKPLNFNEIKEQIDKEDAYIQKMLDDLMHTGIITGIPSRSTGITVYRLLPPFPGIFEFTLMRGGTTEKDKKIAGLFDRMFQEMADMVQEHYDNVVPAFKSIPAIDRIVPVENQVDATKDEILPADEVRKIIDKFDTIAVATCYCRHEKDLINDPCKRTRQRENCLMLGPGAEFTIKYGFARQITKEEARKILKESEDAGLVHKTFHTKLDPEREQEAICSCCKCCCGTFQLFYRGVTAMHSVTYYIARIKIKECTGCGACVDICPMDAIKIVDEVARIEDEKCLGCGLCGHHCEYDAVFLEKTGKREVFVAPPRLK